MISTTLERPPSMDCLVEEYGSREEWLEARRKSIGASDSAGIFGVGYADQSAVTIWDSKRNPPRDINDPAKLKRLKVGKLMEPALRSIFTEETGLECESPGEFTIFRSRELPWLSATCDALCLHDDFGRCPVELKNVSNFAAADWREGDEPPLKFAVQCQQQMAVTGSTHSFLLGLIGGNEPVVKVIGRNERFIAAMLARLEEFWGYVERGELPPIDSSIATAQILSKLWPEDSGMTVAMPGESIEWAAEKQVAERIIKEMKAVETAAENKIKAHLKEATFGDLPSLASSGFVLEKVKDGIGAIIAKINFDPLPARYSWKTQPRKAYSVAAGTTRPLKACK